MGCEKGKVPRALVALKPFSVGELGHGWSSVDLRLPLLTRISCWSLSLPGEESWAGEVVRIKGGGDTETPVPGEFVLD